jgi:hypothetical protein
VPWCWCSPDFSRTWDTGMAVRSSLVSCLLHKLQICWFSLCLVSFLTAPHIHSRYMLRECLNFIVRFKWHKPSWSTVHIHDVLILVCENMSVKELKYYSGWVLYLLQMFIFSNFNFKNFNFIISNYELHMTVWSINYGQILHSASRFIILVSLQCHVIYKLMKNNIKIWFSTITTEVS